MKGSRRGLYLLAAAGLLSLGIGNGTFSTFNAQTTNPGNTFTTGSLTLSNSVNDATACFSYGGSSNTTNQNSCSALVTAGGTNGTYAGAPIATGTVVLTNTGTLDPAHVQLSGPTSGLCTDQYGTQVTASFDAYSAASSTLTDPSTLPSTVTAGIGVSGPGIPPGDTVLSVSGNTITLAAAPNATETATQTLHFSIGKINLDTGSVGTLCTDTALYVEEIAQDPSSGGTQTYTTNCVTGSCPTYATLTTAVTTSSTSSSKSLSLSGALNTSATAPANGDELEITNASGQSAVLTVSGSTSATAITATGSTTATESFPIGSAVVDLSAVPTSGTSIEAFDQATNTSAPSASGTAAPLDLSTPTSWSSPLPHGATRTFQVGLFLPSATGTANNSVQDLSASFDLAWYASQT